jgi:hypothetical protein
VGGKPWDLSEVTCFGSTMLHPFHRPATLRPLHMSELQDSSGKYNLLSLTLLLSYSLLLSLTLSYSLLLSLTLSLSLQIWIEGLQWGQASLR